MYRIIITSFVVFVSFFPSRLITWQSGEQARGGRWGRGAVLKINDPRRRWRRRKNLSGGRGQKTVAPVHLSRHQRCHFRCSAASHRPWLSVTNLDTRSADACVYAAFCFPSRSGWPPAIYMEIGPVKGGSGTCPLFNEIGNRKPFKYH